MKAPWGPSMVPGGDIWAGGQSSGGRGSHIVDNQGICLNMPDSRAGELLAASQGCHPLGCSSPVYSSKPGWSDTDSWIQKAVPSSRLSPSQQWQGAAAGIPNPNRTKPLLTDRMPTTALFPAPEPFLSLALLQHGTLGCWQSTCAAPLVHTPSRVPLWHPELGTWGLSWCPSSCSRTPIPHHSCWRGKSLLSQQAADGIPCPSHPPASRPRQAPGRRHIPSCWHTQQHC